jgi:hypothetical protein
MTAIGSSSSILVICAGTQPIEQIINLAGSFGICSYPMPSVINKCCPEVTMTVLRGPDEFINGEMVTRLRDAIEEVFGFNSAILHAFQDGRNAVSCMEVFPCQEYYLEQSRSPK